MKAIGNTAPGKLEMLERPMPEPRKGQVRIRTAACAICATDLEMIAGCERSRFPQVLGHEWSGVVESAGAGVDGKMVGSPCVAENVLADGGEVGFEHPGGYGQFLVTEARNVQVLPKRFALAAAALIEPLAVCVRGLRRLRLEDRRSALVFGDGPIGLMMAMLLKRDGVGDITLVGGRAERLQVARDAGASRTFNYHEMGDALATALQKKGAADFPNIIEATGSAKALTASFELAAVRGHILLIGDYGRTKLDVPFQRVLHRELEFMASNASAEAWPEAVRQATSGKVPLERLITRIVPAQDFASAFALVRDRKASAIKVVLQW